MHKQSALPPFTPPLLIAATLLALVLGVYVVERWGFRQGHSPQATHAERQLRAEIDLRFQQGVIMLHAKQFEHAMTAFHRVLQLDPEMPEAYVNLGFAMLGQDKFSEAHDFFAGALDLRPGQTNAHYGLALALDGLGDRHAAVESMYRYVNFAVPGDAHRQKAEATLNGWREDLRRKQAAAKGNKNKQKNRKVDAPGTVR